MNPPVVADGGLPLLPRRVRWGLVAVIAVAIFVGSVVLAPPEPSAPSPFWDKQLHFAAYAALALALAYATGSTAEPRSFAAVAGIFLAAAAYGVGIEAVQALAPERHPSALDALANTVGALAVVPWTLVESRLEYVPVGRSP